MLFTCTMLFTCIMLFTLLYFTLLYFTLLYFTCPMLFALLCGAYMYNYLVHTLVAAALLCAQYHVRLLVVLSHMYVDLVFWEDQSQAVHLSRLVALLCVVFIHIHIHMYNYLVPTLVAALLLGTWRRSISSSPLVPCSVSHHSCYTALLSHSTEEREEK